MSLPEDLTYEKQEGSTDNKEREELAVMLQQKYHEATSLNPWLLVTDFILQREHLLTSEAYNEGMKKAAEEIVLRYIDDKYLLNKSKIMFDMVGIATDIITTANKTLGE